MEYDIYCYPIMSFLFHLIIMFPFSLRRNIPIGTLLTLKSIMFTLISSKIILDYNKGGSLSGYNQRVHKIRSIFNGFCHWLD